MSDPRVDPRSTEAAQTTTTEATSPHAEVADRLLSDASRAQAAHEQDDARADEWGRASFPASDPPQNY
ncbi:hypothetical protein [Citricoccus nitrophenolicus]|uniref:hypothetical protein n=1 Tax=Citricoccus nitrophenolicus TaxID=863575 RepID=UPI0031F011C1